jgi:hypothetical protein
MAALSPVSIFAATVSRDSSEIGKIEGESRTALINRGAGSDARSLPANCNSDVGG